MRRDEVPGRALEELAVFPLPNAVLLPGAVMPLRVFEPRYRELTADVLAGAKVLAIARLRPGFEADYYGRPPLYDTAGIGYVAADQKLEDGRYNILVRGLARIEIARELPPGKAYRQIAARVLIDHESDRPALLRSNYDQLVALCDRLADSLPEGGDELRSLVRSAESPADLSDLASAALVSDIDDRQYLLETLDPTDRLESLVERVSQLIADIGGPPRGPMN